MSNGDNSQNETLSDESNGTVSSEFVETLCTIPIVYDSISFVMKFRFGRLTVELADASARKVSGLAKPVLSGPFERADKMAAASVLRLSSQFPFVKQPTDEIIDTIKVPIRTFKQYHEQLGCKIEDNITTPGSRFVMRVDSQLAPYVNIFEGLLQKVVPGNDGMDIQNDQQQNDQQQIAQTFRVFQIALATGDRCVEKVKKQLTSTQSYTTEQLSKLQDSSQLLSSATDTVNTLVVHLRETVQNPNLQTRLQNIASASALLATTESISTYVKSNAPDFPDYLQDRIKPLLTFFEERYGDIVNEIKNGNGNPLEIAKNIIQFTTNHTLPLLKTSQEAIQCYMNSLNTSFHSHLSSAAQPLNVK